jgi:hypothetical protein
MTNTPRAAAGFAPSAAARSAGLAPTDTGDAELPVTDDLLRRLRESGL